MTHQTVRSGAGCRASSASIFRESKRDVHTTRLARADLADPGMDQKSDRGAMARL